MRKAIKTVSVIIAAVLLFFLLSWSIAKLRVHELLQDHPQRSVLSETSGHLVFWVDDRFAPRWRFTAEYINTMTGVTFDAEVSLLGHVIVK